MVAKIAATFSSSAIRLLAPRRAAVAAILRQVPSSDVYELLLLQRVASERDRWSAQIALPGGLVRDETPLSAAIRETAEEVRLDLTSGGFECVAQLDDRLATSDIAVSTFVFCERSTHGPRPSFKLTLQATEIACAWWVPLDQLAAHAVVDSSAAAAGYLPRFLRSRPWLVRALRMEVVQTASIPFTWPPDAGEAVSLPQLPALSSGPPARSPFLWGLTFGIVSDLRRAMGLGALVGACCQLRPNVRFAPQLHPANLMVVGMRLLFALQKMRSRL
ncbi:NUDIX hydrolase domain-like protein [Pavlovales sp. CCMP2436]|nr:NUDIX hydrolase domain-like protein [Pavlovales sp. CCMP2436]|mmetsp:Transcript_44641/g.110674  ORF Transcript_44641/g.110674 Transcript_44641/m.110674 type:complete len:275 (+) Transcript_44641:138-962(+)